MLQKSEIKEICKKVENVPTVYPRTPLEFREWVKSNYLRNPRSKRYAITCIKRNSSSYQFADYLSMFVYTEGSPDVVEVNRPLLRQWDKLRKEASNA